MRKGRVRQGDCVWRRGMRDWVQVVPVSSLPSSAEWFYMATDRLVRGPVALPELPAAVAMGLLNQSSLVWISGSDERRPVFSILGLMEDPAGSGDSQGQWYCAVGNTHLGPLSVEAVEELVRQGRVRPGDWVWRGDMQERVQVVPLSAFPESVTWFFMARDGLERGPVPLSGLAGAAAMGLLSRSSSVWTSDSHRRRPVFSIVGLVAEVGIPPAHKPEKATRRPTEELTEHSTEKRGPESPPPSVTYRPESTFDLGLADGHKEQDPTTQQSHSGGAAAEEQMGMKWFFFWTYFSMPVSGVIALSLTLETFRSDRSEAVVALVLCALFFSVSLGLNARKRWAWWLNWVPLVLVPFTREYNAETAVALLVILPLWLVPNFFYWKRRIRLFS